MYFPEFSITSKIINSVAKIEAAKEVAKVIALSDPFIKSLARENAIKTCFHATHFDGNTLTYDSIKALFDGKDVAGTPKNIQEVLNYKKALELIQKPPVIGEETFKDLHKTLLKNIAPANRIGVFRTSLVHNSQVTFEVPAPDEILALMVSFMSWLESPDALELPTAIRSAMIYLELTRIQPFETENKKIAGLTALLNLNLDGYDENHLISLEAFIDESPTAYSQALRSTQNPTGDVTKWIEYFLAGLASEFEETKERLIALAKDQKVMKVAGMAPLNDREERLVEYLHDYGFLQNKDFKKLFPEISEDTILRDLKDLMAKGIIVKTGSTKSSLYSISGQQGPQ